MAIPDNGYIDDASVLAFCRRRYPNNFTATVPDAEFQGYLWIAGDIVNSNSNAFIGEPRPGLTGGRTWPRQTVGGTDERPYLTLDLPDPLLRGYEWLVIAAALSPGVVGHNTTGSSTATLVTGALKKIGYGNLEIEYAPPSRTDTTTTSVESELTDHLRWHYEQASVFLSQLLRPGGVLRLPGIDRDKPKPEKAYYTLSDFCSK